MSVSNRWTAQTHGGSRLGATQSLGGEHHVQAHRLRRRRQAREAAPEVVALRPERAWLGGQARCGRMAASRCGVRWRLLFFFGRLFVVCWNRSATGNGRHRTGIIVRPLSARTSTDGRWRGLFVVVLRVPAGSGLYLTAVRGIRKQELCRCILTLGPTWSPMGLSRTEQEHGSHHRAPRSGA